MMKFIEPHIVPSSCPLAGNSIHCDKQFLQKYMPDFMKQLHYRIIDVSSIKELCR
jgi:oligoribonuclease